MNFSFLAATMGTVCAGSVMGWTSPALPYLHKAPVISNASDYYNYTAIGSPSSVLPVKSDVAIILDGNVTETEGMSTTEVSWIGSLAPLGALVGALPAGYLANLIGRKRLMLLLTLPYLLGWILIIVAAKSVSRFKIFLL
jgi:SP family facilitated glucose transporter-like MFS transporter 8